MYRREQALKDLPGPKHPFLVGLMVDLVCRRDPHRYATELAEQYGPIFKFRLLIFHVSASGQFRRKTTVVSRPSCPACKPDPCPAASACVANPSGYRCITSC